MFSIYLTYGFCYRSWSINCLFVWCINSSTKNMFDYGFNVFFRTNWNMRFKLVPFSTQQRWTMKSSSSNSGAWLFSCGVKLWLSANQLSFSQLCVEVTIEQTLSFPSNHPLRAESEFRVKLISVVFVSGASLRTIVVCSTGTHTVHVRYTCILAK